MRIQITIFNVGVTVFLFSEIRGKDYLPTVFSMNMRTVELKIYIYFLCFVSFSLLLISFFGCFFYFCWFFIPQKAISFVISQRHLNVFTRLDTRIQVFPIISFTKHLFFTTNLSFCFWFLFYICLKIVVIILFLSFFFLLSSLLVCCLPKE